MKTNRIHSTMKQMLLVAAIIALALLGSRPGALARNSSFAPHGGDFAPDTRVIF